jgi:ABC-type transporter Mla MlaB component
VARPLLFTPVVMLRITKVDGCLVVEGRISGPWVDELARAVGAGSEARAVDVSGVGYVDPAGAKLLLSLIAQGIAIRESSAYVAEVLKGAGRES